MGYHWARMAAVAYDKLKMAAAKPKNSMKLKSKLLSFILKTIATRFRSLREHVGTKRVNGDGLDSFNFLD